MNIFFNRLLLPVGICLRRDERVVRWNKESNLIVQTAVLLNGEAIGGDEKLGAKEKVG